MDTDSGNGSELGRWSYLRQMRPAVWLTLAGAWSLVTNAQALAEYFVAEPTRQEWVQRLPDLTFRDWLIGMLLLAIAALFEGSFRYARRLKAERDAVREEVQRKRKNQELADYLSERVEYGTNEILNKGPTRDEYAAWKARETEWREEILDRMEKFGCSEQEIQRIKLLVVYDRLRLANDPLVNAVKSMLAERLLRLTEIAERYAE